jgi:surface antigen
VRSLAPGEGAPGWLVRISGSGFTRVRSVSFAGVRARFKVVSSRTIKSWVPASARNGRVRVRTAAGTAESRPFRVTPVDSLLANEVLPPGDALRSLDGHYRLTMRFGGDLVETDTAGRVLWSTGTSAAHSVAIMQADGNFVVYAPGAKPVWAAGTGGHPAAAFILAIQPDANLVIYPPGSTALWSNGAVNDVLSPGEALRPGWYLESSDRHYQLVMQTDGNLVYYVTGTDHPFWASGTAGHPGDYLVMQTDGNLVIYAADKKTPLWQSNTAGQGPATFAAQVDGNLVTYQGAKPTWASGSYDNSLQPGESLLPGWYLESGNGYELIMQSDGNLVEYGGSGPIWATGTAGHPGAYVVMQGDGNLVIYDGPSLWASRTAGHPGAVMIDQQDGNQVVYQDGKALWASKAGGVQLTLGSWPGTGGPGAANKYYGYPYADPPACTDGGACVVDAWDFYEGQCTSWVAYRLNELNGIPFTDHFGGGTWGDASNWGSHAEALGIAVNGTPAVGSVAWYSSGHVAYVEQVSSPTSIVISEMNYDFDNGFRVRTITTSSGWPTGFIHIADR